MNTTSLKKGVMTSLITTRGQDPGFRFHLKESMVSNTVQDSQKARVTLTKSPIALFFFLVTPLEASNQGSKLA